MHREGEGQVTTAICNSDSKKHIWVQLEKSIKLVVGCAGSPGEEWVHCEAFGILVN